ncbi:MAG: hypothetical protein R6W76_10195 [Caldilinea sp.]
MRTYRHMLVVTVSSAMALVFILLVFAPMLAQDNLPPACYGRMDILYACQNGYRPVAAPTQPAPLLPPICTSRMDYYYACQNGWRP